MTQIKQFINQKKKNNTSNNNNIILSKKIERKGKNEYKSANYFGVWIADNIEYANTWNELSNEFILIKNTSIVKMNEHKERK